MASSFVAQLADALETPWSATARPNQLPPPGHWWQIWLLLAGRGFGKTRTLAEWVCQQTASGQASRFALVAATAADARDVLVEGESGILAVAPPWFRPVYESSKRRLTWPNGALATTFSAEEPERLRGPQHDAAVCHLVAWISRVDAVIAGPLGLMRCGRSWGVPAPACGSGCRQQLPPRLLDACRFASAARDRLPVSSGRYRLPPRHASCTPTLSANPSGHVRQSRSDAGHAVWARSRPSGSAPHSTAVAR